MTNLIKVGAIAALATVGVIFGNVTASALETTPPAAPKITVSTAQYKGDKIQLNLKVPRTTIIDL